MKKASRYRLSGENKESSKYLAIYEFDSKEDLEAFPKSPEFAAAVKDFDEKWKDGGFERKWGASYELIKVLGENRNHRILNHFAIRKPYE